MIAFDCERCGHVDHALLDGYPFGDRLLEGVVFECRKNDDGTFDITVREDCQPYFSKLNADRWLSEARKYARKADLFTCPNCGDDVAPLD